ncbi:MAG: VWA domain-containing protein [Chloroflexi bacterium]|nr:VWA domain-containing protein [Chloroflexota bacterium]
MSATQGLKYTVDIVLCIDSTGSMGSIIGRVKSSALKFYEDVSEKMAEKDKVIDSLRLKVISFRDYFVDGKDAMIESEFFLLPKDKEAFTAFVETIRADGGGDEPENGLEALALAIKSEWATTGDRRRQIIVIWTDASAHPLEKDGKPSGYPKNMPSNFDELADMWDGQGFVNHAAKRLIIYAPDAYAWTDIATNWEMALHFPSKGGEGLADIEYGEILDQIVRSV